MQKNTRVKNAAPLKPGKPPPLLPRRPIAQSSNNNGKQLGARHPTLVMGKEMPAKSQTAPVKELAFSDKDISSALDAFEPQQPVGPLSAGGSIVQTPTGKGDVSQQTVDITLDLDISETIDTPELSPRIPGRSLATVSKRLKVFLAILVSALGTFSHGVNTAVRRTGSLSFKGASALLGFGSRALSLLLRAVSRSPHAMRSLFSNVASLLGKLAPRASGAARQISALDSVKTVRRYRVAALGMVALLTGLVALLIFAFAGVSGGKKGAMEPATDQSPKTASIIDVGLQAPSNTGETGSKEETSSPSEADEGSVSKPNDAAKRQGAVSKKVSSSKMKPATTDARKNKADKQRTEAGPLRSESRPSRNERQKRLASNPFGA